MDKVVLLKQLESLKEDYEKLQKEHEELKKKYEELKEIQRRRYAP